MYNFPLPPNEAAANQIQANGGEVNMLSQGAWKISGNGIELLYEPAFRWITRATYQGDQIVEKDIRQYAPNDQGVLAAAQSRHRGRDPSTGANGTPRLSIASNGFAWPGNARTGFGAAFLRAKPVGK